MTPQTRKRFNYLASESPFILPPPIPEPPRVINVRPMVPDLSLISENSPNVSPKASPNRKRFDINRQYYPSIAPKLHLPQTNQLMASQKQHMQHLENYGNDFLAKLSDSEPKECSEATNAKQVIDHNSARNKCFDTLPSNLKVTDLDSKKSSKHKSQSNLEPKIIKHSMDHVFTKSSKDTADLKRAANDKLQHTTPSNEQMYEIIQQQDQYLQKISEQIEELLRFHKIQEKAVINDNKAENCVEKRSVMTMTSMVWDNKLNHMNHSKPKTKVRNVNRSTPKTPSTTSKDMRVLHFHTPSDCHSYASVVDIDSDRLNFTNSPIPEGNASNEMSSTNINECDDLYYDRMMDNIQDLLSDRSNDETEEDSGRRSSCSPTPPRLIQDVIPNRNRIHIQSEQTLYIKKLASKYLVDDQTTGETKTKCKQNKPFTNYQKGEQKNLRAYGLPNNVSIATKNYLEKYDLLNKNMSPPRVTKTQQKFDNKSIRNRNQHKVCQPFKNRLLDLETLKRQPKLK